MRALKEITALILCAAIPAAAVGQQIGDAEKGMYYVSEVCAPCHAVHSGEPASPVPEAPRFEDVANTLGMTAIALTVWFKTSHPTMPNIIIEDEDMRNVIQYILSLKRD